MRHRVAHRKLSRPADHRMALLKNLVQALITHEKIRTTEQKAKEARSLAEKVITLTKHPNGLFARRQARRILEDESLVKRLFDEIGPRYTQRPGGYTRIVRLGYRRGDAARIVQLELVE